MLKKNCKQPFTRAEDIDRQISDVLGRISIPKEFTGWAVKEHINEKTHRKEITKTYRKNLDTAEKRLDNLLDMRLNNEISHGEFTEKKKELTRGKRLFVDDNWRRLL